MSPIQNNPSIPQHAPSIAEGSHVPQTSAAASKTTTPATALRPGQGPVTKKQIDTAMSNQQELIELASRTPSPERAGTEVVTVASDALAAQRAVLLGLHSDPSATPMARLTAQFRLEAIALREVLDPDTVTKLIGKELTREVVAEESPIARGAVADRANLYDAVNTGAPGSVHPPFSDAQLDAAGIRPPPGPQNETADARTARHDAHNHTQRLCLTHDAYEKAIVQLQGDPSQAAALQDVTLAHEAFKVAIASTHSVLESTQMNLQARVDVAKNKMLLKSADNRTNKLATLEPQLVAAKASLAAHARASDYILHHEHLLDHKRRSISPDEGVLSWLNKVGQQTAVAGAAQAMASLLSWGYGRSLGTTLAEFIAGDKTGAWPMILTTVLEAATLAASHEIVSNGPKDLIQALTELGGWARPAEQSNANQLFPDARSNTLDAKGNITVVDATDAQAAVEASRASLKKQAQTNAFGNVSADFKGESSFAAANLTRDAITSAGFDGASSRHGRAVTSGLGGALMSTLHSVGQLGKQVDGIPTHVTPLRQNPRTLVERLITGMQKYDLTNEANRLNVPSKFTSAFLGILGANATEELFSGRVEAKQIGAGEAKDKAAEAAWAILHAFLEGTKSYATLGPFFSGLAAAGDSKNVKVFKHPDANRALIGWQALSKPRDPANTSAYVPGSHGYRRQALNNVIKGSAQLVAQPPAVGLKMAAEVAVEGGVAGVKGAFKGGVAGVEWVGKGIAAATPSAETIRNLRQTRGRQGQPDSQV